MKFKFDERTHTYTLDGVVLPSVTQILEGVGLVPDYPIGNYRIRGQRVHEATLHYDNGVLDNYEVGDRIMPYVDSYVKSMEKFPFTWKEAEIQLWHPYYLFAGKIDRVGFYDDKYPCIGDFKSGRTGRETGLQLAGYALLKDNKNFLLQSCGHYYRRFKLELQPNGSCGKLTEYKDKVDFPGFLGSLELFKWKMKGNHKGT
jgi:hypothetical protein